eukprot:gb/GFBE01023993.1/.p1 GENE.gb/GFBE01023993.1/~~gb/GFBE01023993.1/.p1  ORF type:complete len:818 (+),score=261.25 gb/GFBE01023993.1/:1-2454(+)
MADTKREAAALFSKAEAYLRDEQIEDCIATAAQAVRVFEELGDAGAAGLTDALFMLIDAHRLLAIAKQEKPQEGLTLAKENLERFRAAGNRRGEGMMMLSLAEINADKRGRKNRSESLEVAAQALQIFRDIEDRKSEAATLLVMATAHYKFFMYDDMLQEAQEALEILEELGDMFYKGKALNMVGLALSSFRRIEPAMEKGKAAMAIWRELGLKRQEGIQSHIMAGWLLGAREPKKALALCEQTMELFRAIGPAGLPGGVKYRREALSAHMIVALMMELKQFKNALKFAKSAYDRFVEVDSKFGMGMMKDCMSRVYIALDKPDKAIEAVDEAREIAEGLGDKKWSAKLLFGVAQAHMKSKATDEAIETLDKSINLAQAAGDSQEATRLQHNLIDALLFRQRNPKAALRVAREARSAAQRNNDKRAEAMAILREAMVESALGKREDAIQLAKQAQEFFQEGYWPRGEAQCLQFISEVRSQLGDIDAALESAEERLAVLRELNDLSLESQALVSVANLHLKDENFTEAEKVAKEALTLGQKDRNPKAQIEALLVQIQIYGTQLGDKTADDKAAKPLIDKSVRIANEALQIAGKAQNRSVRAIVLYKRAETMIMARRHQTALRDAKEASALFQEFEDYQSFARSLLLLSNIKHSMDQTEEGNADMDTAAHIAREIGDSTLIEEVNTFRKALEERKAELERQSKPQVHQPQLDAAPVAGPAVDAPQAVAASVAAEPAKPKGLDAVHVRKQLGAMVKDAIASDEDLELDSPFMDAGMDSLSSVALMSMVAKEFQMALSPSLVFDFPTLRAMEEHLVEESKNM